MVVSQISRLVLYLVIDFVIPFFALLFYLFSLEKFHLLALRLENFNRNLRSQTFRKHFRCPCNKHSAVSLLGNDFIKLIEIKIRRRISHAINVLYDRIYNIFTEMAKIALYSSRSPLLLGLKYLKSNKK